MMGSIPVVTARVPGKVYFLLSRMPGPYSEFIELEDDQGRSISIGRWVRLRTSPVYSEVYALEIDDPRGVGCLKRHQVGQ